MADFNFKESLSKAYKEQQDVLQQDFMKIARTQKWPENVINGIRVEVKDDKIVLVRPDSLNEQIQDLENGKFTNPPAAAIRQFTGRISNTVGKKAIATTIVDLIDKVLL